VGAVDHANAQLEFNELVEYTADAGVKVEGNLIKDGAINYQALSTGTSTAYVLTFSPALTLQDGMEVSFYAHEACGDNPTLNVNGTGAKALVTESGTSIKTGMIGDNQYIRARYRLSTTKWVVTNLDTGPQAFTSAWGTNSNLTYGTFVTETAYYQARANQIILSCYFSGTLGGSDSSYLDMDLPVVTALADFAPLNARYKNSGTVTPVYAQVRISPDTVRIYKEDGTNITAAGASQEFWVWGSYFF
jgi:hypothetical protein